MKRVFVLCASAIFACALSPNARAWERSNEALNPPDGCKVEVWTEADTSFTFASAVKACTGKKPTENIFNAAAASLVSGIDWSLINGVADTYEGGTLRDTPSARLDRQGKANEFPGGGVNLQIQLGGADYSCKERGKSSNPIATTVATLLLDKGLTKMSVAAQQRFVAQLVRRLFGTSRTGQVRVKIAGSCAEAAPPPVAAKFGVGWTVETKSSANEQLTRLDAAIAAAADKLKQRNLGLARTRVLAIFADNYTKTSVKNAQTAVDKALAAR